MDKQNFSRPGFIYISLSDQIYAREWYERKEYINRLVDWLNENVPHAWHWRRGDVFGRGIYIEESEHESAVAFKLII